MANNDLGELRRSAVIMTFGPGSIVDFLADRAPVSVVMAGLEEWGGGSSSSQLQKIIEPRLQRKLSEQESPVREFCLPPVVDEDGYNEFSQKPLVAVRFPGWLQCSQCNRLAPVKKWGSDLGRAYRYCESCTIKAPGQRKVFAIPVRFLMGCEQGHLDDFPWHIWVAHKENCKNFQDSQGDLYLESRYPGLAGLILICRECEAEKSMRGIFSAQAWERTRCRGRRPWLAGDPKENCQCTPRALQRGASNLYFPIIESALSIPPWSDLLQEALGLYWSAIVNVENSEERAKFIRTLASADTALELVMEDLGVDSMELAQEIEDRIKQYNGDAIMDIRGEEYRWFVAGDGRVKKNDTEFEVRSVSVPQELRPFFSRVTRVVRLREVRALRGFTRINPPGDEGNPNIVALSADRLDWLPADEVRGEGVFLAFNLERLGIWEAQERVVERAKRVGAAWKKEWQRCHGEDVSAQREEITPRYLLIHTFAHALMRQLTLECGYSTASLRERMYVREDMAGLLIYTATPDSDGTLGGLQRQGEGPRIKPTIITALQAMEWCSSDPLCIQTEATGAGRLSLAACHACVLAPETSCEQYNRFLDRAMLVGHPDAPEVGFFNSVRSA